MPLRVSLVNLQKFTFQAWLDAEHEDVGARAEHRSLALVTTTVRTSGCSKRMRLMASCSSMSTPRS
jgi:hypothetical protein